MSQVSPKTTADALLPLSRPDRSQSNDRNRGDSGDQEMSTSLQNPRPSGQVLDDPPNFTDDLIEHSRDPLDSWPGQVEMRPRRRSALLSSLFRGNQPHRSFFGNNVKDDEAGPDAVEKNQASKAFDSARRLSKTAVSAMKDKVPLPPVPWKQKRSLSQSANSRARAHISILSSFYLAQLTILYFFVGVQLSFEPSEEVHPLARKGFPHLWRAVSPRRVATFLRGGQAADPSLVRVHPRHHHGLIQRRRDAHDRAPLCALQWTHRALGPQQRPRRLPRRL
jgi:hypothetical protein